MEGSVPVTNATTSREGFVQRIRSREALVGIIGMGYVGLPLALTFAERGFKVLGFDVDPEKVAAIGRARATSSTSTPRGSPPRPAPEASSRRRTSRASASPTRSSSVSRPRSPPSASRT